MLMSLTVRPTNRQIQVKASTYSKHNNLLLSFFFKNDSVRLLHFYTGLFYVNNV